jgi:hypothetical protein
MIDAEPEPLVARPTAMTSRRVAFAALLQVALLLVSGCGGSR